MRRRMALLLVGLGAQRLVRPQQGAPGLVIIGASDSVPITDSAGKISYRFPAFNGTVTIGLGDGHSIELCCVPSGAGLMGDEREWSAFSSLRATPVHSIRVPGFLLGKYEVTKSQWLRVAQLPRVNRDLFLPIQMVRPEEGRWPMEFGVSALQAEEFCARVARFSGTAIRLPSEAEWEYACRAGTTTWYHFGDSFGEDVLASEVMSIDTHQPVGNRNAPNRFGLHDMHGGVGEWCADWSYPDYTGAPNDGSPRTGSGNPDLRVIRGAYLRMGSAGRAHFVRNGFATGLGLRVAASYAHGIVDPRPRAALHGVTGRDGVASPGQILSIQGDSIGPQEGVSAKLEGEQRVTISLADVQVFVDELPAPILFASKERVDLLVPMSIRSGNTAMIVLRYGLQSSAPLSVVVRDAAPGLLLREQSSGRWIWAINEGGGINDSSERAARGSVVVFYGNGFGALTPEKPDGVIVNDALADLPRPARPVRVWIGDSEATVEYCGQAPGMVLGIIQINARVPQTGSSGGIRVMVAAGDVPGELDGNLWIA